MQTYNDTPYATFLETDTGALDGKEGHAVALDDGENTVKLATGSSNSIGFIKQKLQNGPIGDGAVNIRLLGKGGTLKAVSGAVIAKGSRVKVDASGRLIAAASGDRSVGIKLTQGNSAAGDVIEILDIIETAP